MGGDRKSKEEKKRSRKRSPSLSSSEDEGQRRKRHRREKEEAGERKSRKSDDKKEKRKDKKSHKHRSDKEKKSKDKHRAKHHKGDMKIQELSSDDYFLKNNEFSTWLQEEREVFFSDLSSESARELFSDFVKDWNNQKLDSRFYEGISKGPRCAHSWKFKKKHLDLAFWCRKITAFNSKSILSPPYPSNLRPISAISSQCIQLPQESTNHGQDTVILANHPNPEISCFYQKGFSQITRESTGKALHALCIKGLEDLGVFFNNTLINMYSKFGHMGLARYVFDKMSERNESSWNHMMSAFVRAGLYRESIVFLNEMMNLGINPSGFAISSLITACERSGFMLIEGIQVHDLVVKLGFLSDVFVGTSLLHFYGAYELGLNARMVFDEMPDKNVVSWTAMMVAYADIGDSGEVMDMYAQMRWDGVSCNANNLATVISSCGSLEDELLGVQILGQAMKFGLETDVSVGNALVSMFGSFGRVEEACYVFGGMNERDTISWNSMISVYVRNGLCEESLRCFRWMRAVHDCIDSTTLASLLSGCDSVDYLKWGRGIQSLAVKSGLDTNVCVCNTLIAMYSGAGESEYAELVFRRMADRDLISWNSMLACHVQNGNCMDALKVFMRIFRLTRGANYVTFTSALAACSNPEFVTEAKILHALVMITGLQENLIVGNALITLYAKSGMMVEAKKAFQTICKRDVVSWNALIGGYADNEEPDDALKFFVLMREDGVRSNYITISNVLGACATPNVLFEHGMPIHAYAVTTGLESDEYVQNSLVTMYAKCGDLDSSNSVFRESSNKNAVAWNAAIAANARHGEVEEALKLLAKMRHVGLDLDQFSFSECLAGTATLAMLEEGQQLQSLAIKLGFESDPFVYNAMMDMYAKCGEIDDVLRIIPQPLQRSRLSWNILISSFAKHGCFDKARETFHEMLKLGVKPDHVTFVSLLSACSHGGLVEEGLAYYNSMTKEFDVRVGINHCVCIVDLLGRSGRLAEAEAFIKQMPVPPTDLIWRSLLAASKTHCNLELGRKAAENIFKIDPSDDSAYVLYSNVCASTGRWDDVETLRKRMGSNKIKKKRACSWVKSKNEISTFGMGDQSHPRSSQIYGKLEELKRMIKEAGYVPDTSYALQDTDEEQKEHNLWNHSERLALAFGLLTTPEYSTIKVFKNLRVCGDCHSVYKFVSELLGRKIILRDPYRFHHFSGGKCSCSDYW
ncbi:putative pentatricopeptide repeat-containing protein At3g23330 [Euphorbia lathyris]|uniref:putative pentatricopeptide repeat-containing protein At3g23330 n=1 Tax=Euphorbia lathyris TaxID=212925 RepID=UPI003314325A